MTLEINRGYGVSIIVATYNCASTLGRTLDSILSQDFENVEVIIQDGGSCDGTVELLSNINDSRLVWTSHSDSGIYDAWNQGLRKATMPWVAFLGGDDYFVSPMVLTDIFCWLQESNRKVDFLSGRIEYVDRDGNLTGKSYGKAWSRRRIKKSHCIAHPGAVFRRDLWSEFGFFSLDYSIAGDYEFTLRLGPDVSNIFVPEVFVHMGDSGVSSEKKLEVMLQVAEIQLRSGQVGYFQVMITMAFSLLGMLKAKAGALLTGKSA